MFIFLFLYPIESVIKLIVDFKMKRILITGGTGFLGINLAKKLNQTFGSDKFQVYQLSTGKKING